MATMTDTATTIAYLTRESSGPVPVLLMDGWSHSTVPWWNASPLIVAVVFLKLRARLAHHQHRPHHASDQRCEDRQEHQLSRHIGHRSLPLGAARHVRLSHPQYLPRVPAPAIGRQPCTE